MNAQSREVASVLKTGVVRSCALRAAMLLAVCCAGVPSLRGESAAGSDGTAIRSLPSIENWATFYESLTRARALSPNERDGTVSKLSEKGDAHSVRVQALTVMVKGYVERVPGRLYRAGAEATGFRWFRPVFCTFETPGGLADRASWTREVHLARKSNELWIVQEKLWHEDYFRETGYPLTRGQYVKVHATRVGRLDPWDEAELLEATYGTDSLVDAGHLFGLVEGPGFQLSPLTMPLLFDSMPALRVPGQPEAAYGVDVAGRLLHVLRWRLGALRSLGQGGASSSSELTVVVDPGVRQGACRIVVHRGPAISLLAAYDDFLTRGTVHLPQHIRIHRAQVYSAPQDGRNVVMTDSLELTVHDAEVTEMNGEDR